MFVQCILAFAAQLFFYTITYDIQTFYNSISSKRSMITKTNLRFAFNGVEFTVVKSFSIPPEKYQRKYWNKNGISINYIVQINLNSRT